MKKPSKAKVSKKTSVRAKKPTKKPAMRVKCPLPPRVTEPPLPTTTIVSASHTHEDERGKIENFLARPLGSYAVISSKKGTVRAEHWHKADWHFCHVVRGQILYFERPVGSDMLPAMTRVTEGQMFFTGPNVEHSMLFVEDTVFTCMGKLTREQDSYEHDLVRLEKRLTDLPLIRATYIDPPQPTAKELVQPEVVETASQDKPVAVAVAIAVAPAPGDMPGNIQ
jgi:dTDP-4-dehydrorhamnose 3,5-epimerase-like enzyme